jgi:predicted transcriptional regulator
MNESFVLANKNRVALFMELGSGETNLEHITKKHHMVGPAAKAAAEDLIGAGLVADKGGKLSLTAEGQKISTDMKHKGLLR